MPVARIGNDKAALAAPGLEPVFARNYAALAAARDADVGVVLWRAVDVIRKRIVHGDVIELRRRLVIHCRPGLAPIDRDAGAAVVGIRDSLASLRIDPKPVMIAMACWEEVKSLAAIDRAEEPGV